ncbi:arginine repressor [Photobacterium carnosum]|uniref:arginine repressor n=1 Tax=Photobacterium carnosum TaxID=2023717 RepID=UPI001E3A95F6|nr:arginine repressor [Photobacterium carnosum]MCD9494557.1 arginine repressor [Photobacterium carnosum]MCD9552386.1 arginine repressor [Photobacterium carnosum]
MNVCKKHRLSTTNKSNDNLITICKQLLQQQSFTVQSDIRNKLIELGFHDISSSTVSRLLFRLGVIKIPNASGKKIYCLPNDDKSIKINTSIASQIEFITHNQLVVIVKTKPGSARIIAKFIDRNPHQEILGAIAGNDTIMIAPRDINHITECEKAVDLCLGRA